MSKKDTYIVMELLSGGELFNRIVDAGPFPEADAAALFAQILLSMDYLLIKHCASGREAREYPLPVGGRQADQADRFGYAGVWTPERPLTGLYGGTPDYVAPEVLSWYDDEENGTPYGKGSDLWSLGVLLYVILSGCSPFSADEEEAILELVAKAKYEFHEAEWSSISDGAKDLISKLLVVDPLQRLTMQQLLDHSWLKGSVAAAKASIEAAKKGGSKKGSSKAAGAPSAMVSAAQRTADGVAAEKPGELNPTVLQPGGGSKKGACCVIS